MTLTDLIISLIIRDIIMANKIAMNYICPESLWAFRKVIK